MDAVANIPPMAEILLCKNREPGNPLTDTVNILHVGPDTPEAAAELARMAEFMRTAGYDVECKRGPGMAFGEDGEPHGLVVDMVVLGTDAHIRSMLDNILDIYTRDYGIVPEWDVLLYHTDGGAPPRTTSPAGQFSSLAFGQDGVCLLYRHITMRMDERLLEGFFAGIGIELEVFADSVIGRSKHSLHKKIECMRQGFEVAGLHGPDTELFLAAADILRDIRNTLVHSQRNMDENKRAEKIRENGERLISFVEMAERNGRQALHTAWPIMWGTRAVN